MNFAINGRHLADQDYIICMKQSQGKYSFIFETVEYEVEIEKIWKSKNKTTYKCNTQKRLEYK